jgi:hypothetical protein
MNRDPIKPDLPLTGRTLVAALVVIALSAWISSFFPWGFAQ